VLKNDLTMPTSGKFTNKPFVDLPHKLLEKPPDPCIVELVSIFFDAHNPSPRRQRAYRLQAYSAVMNANAISEHS
jgi:hypothetical protein